MGKIKKRTLVIRELFYCWFHDNFEPYIREKMPILKMEQNVFLILENAQGHPANE
jgi:hypothetical protein